MDKYNSKQFNSKENALLLLEEIDDVVLASVHNTGIAFNQLERITGVEWCL